MAPPSMRGAVAALLLLAASVPARQGCEVAGMVPGLEEPCVAPREWALVNLEARRGAATPSWFELQRFHGQPGLSAEQLRSGGVPGGHAEIRPLYLSVDPYLAGGSRSLAAGAVMQSYTVGEVVRCSAPCPYSPGTRLMSQFFWKESQIWSVEHLPKVTPNREVLVLPEQLPPKVLPSHYIGFLGMPGWTAYSGLFRIGNVTCPGETILVSGAAGVCGAMVGQMAKILGCRVIGTAGSEAKVQHLKDSLGFDEALNYKTHATADSMREALSAVAPEGIDFYFDNTAGHVTTAVWPLLRDGARVAICGGIAHYFAEPSWWSHAVWWKELPLEEDGSAPIGPTAMGQGPVSTTSRGRRIVVEALVWQQLHDRQPYEEEFNERVPRWISEGKLKVDETVCEGFERIPEAFAGLFQGHNFGKMLVHASYETGVASSMEL